MVYYYDGQRIIETRDGSGNVYQQMIHGTQYIDELVMVRVKNKGDLYIHQGERSEREAAATGRADRMFAPGGRPARRKRAGVRATGGTNWNVIAATDLGGNLVERYFYRPYGELFVWQDTGFGDRDGDGDVDSVDKGTVGTTCTGTVTGACRILDLDFDGDYDSTDAGLFDSLPQGRMRREGRRASVVHQTFGHQGLLFEPETDQYQNRARQYDAGKRRFGQRDPLATRARAATMYNDGLNLYVYVMSSPLNWMDPMGLKSCSGWYPPTPGTFTARVVSATPISLRAGVICACALCEVYHRDCCDLWLFWTEVCQVCGPSVNVIVQSPPAGGPKGMNLKAYCATFPPPTGLTKPRPGQCPK